jgi:hypothetical protein
MRNNTKPLVRNLLVLLPGLVLLASLFVGVPPTFAQSSVVSTSSLPMLTKNEGTGSSVPTSCPTTEVYIAWTSMATPDSIVGARCYPEGFYPNIHIPYVDLIDLGPNYNVVILWTDCTPQQATHGPTTIFYGHYLDADENTWGAARIPWVQLRLSTSIMRPYRLLCKDQLGTNKQRGRLFILSPEDLREQ